MRAAVLREAPGPLRVETVELDDPRRGEVVVRVAAAGLCHTDLHFMQGKLAHPTPTVLGHESAGVVEAVGEGVSSLAPGDHVVACNSSYCGECEYCWSGQMWLCPRRNVLNRGSGERQRLSQGGVEIDQFANLAGFAELMLVHERSLVAVQKEMPLDRASLLGCAVMTGTGAVFNSAAVEPGSAVAVLGCGGVGLNCVQGARLAGALRIIAVDVLPAKLELAREMGATDVVDASGADAVEAVRELSGGGVDYSFEAIGNPRTIEQSVRMLCKAGLATVIGWMPEGSTIAVPGAELRQSKRIQGCSGGSNHFKVDIPRLAELYLRDELLLDPLISGRIGLEQINEGYEELEDGDVARSIVVFGS